MTAIDLNSDLGEAFGAYRLGDDAALFGLISSANVACGFHGGDPRVMEATVAAAAAAGVAVGAHPGFLDLAGFGRRIIAASPDEVRTDVLYQIGALDAFCRAAGVRLVHVKAHGALYHAAIADPALAGAIAAAVAAYDPALILVGQPGTALVTAGTAVGLAVAREGFADRAYHRDGRLVSRHRPGSVIADPEEAAERALRLVAEGTVTTIEGDDLALTVDTLCIHSDTPGAVAIATAIRRRFAEAGVEVRPLQPLS
ncbi:MAG: Lactam utilization protein LamB [uncultured Thermomicrobiales bacterium]|uniref:5-oxoprolinase subunit A n=1 Tax=uncultured Thermomicrobiales bacterium TaxID=1645740 RepID=A0A6J4TDE9_9BACT|nr:MAG: Lactam utilization protein LamB [uncultured Thermomicrobiales bacterium]